MVELLAEEREHIRLEETYRREVADELRRGKHHDNLFWLEKVVVPILLLLVTALASGLVVPYILRKGDDRRHAVDLKSVLIRDLVGDSAMMQTALKRYNEQMCDYWLMMARLANNRRSANAMPQGDERDRRLKAIDTALEKEYDLRVAADPQIANARMTFAVAKDRFRSLIILYYGDSPTLRTFLRAAESDGRKADELLDVEHQNALGAIYRDALAQYKTCKDATECDAVFANADERIERIRDSEPQFGAWRAATQAMASYILEQRPKLTSD